MGNQSLCAVTTYPWNSFAGFSTPTRFAECEILPTAAMEDVAVLIRAREMQRGTRQGDDGRLDVQGDGIVCAGGPRLA